MSGPVSCDLRTTKTGYYRLCMYVNVVMTVVRVALLLDDELI